MARRLWLTAVSIVTVLAIAWPAQAATVTITDAIGDANAVNDQGFLVDSPVPNDNTINSNASRKEMDIQKVTLTNSAANFSVVLTLRGAPKTAQVIYRVTGDVAQANDCTTFFVEYVTHAEGPAEGQLRTCDPDDLSGVGGIYTNVPVKVKGKTITWTISYTTLQSLGVKNKNATSLGAHDRLLLGTGATGGATIPQVDQVTSTRSIKLGP